MKTWTCLGVLFIAFLVVSCNTATPVPLPTYTPQPTYTPYPKFTPPAQSIAVPVAATMV